MKLKDAEKHIEGIGCTCSAYCQGECGCGADWTPKLEHIVNAWHNMTSRELNEHCGVYLTDPEVQRIRGVISSILKSSEYRPTSEEVRQSLLDWEMKRLKDEADFNNGLDYHQKTCDSINKP